MSESKTPSWESINEDSLSLFDNFIHDNYGAPKSEMGEVVFCRDEDTFAEFRDWVLESRRPFAFDTETNGLYQYEQNFEIKLLQWGDTEKAYVFVCGEPWFQRSIDFMMDETDGMLIAHNATFDALTLDSCGHVDALKILERTHDTYIFSHLIDPRGIKEGGTGHKLSNLSWAHVDDSAPDSDMALKQLFKSQGWRISDGYSKIPTTHPTLVQYAGMDVILTARLYPKLVEIVKRKDMGKLVAYEHRLLYLCAALERKGIRVDREFAQKLYDSFDDRRKSYMATLAEMGVRNPEAPIEVAVALQKLGEVLTDKTAKSGEWQIDNKVLEAIVGREGPGARLAETVMLAKNSAKWRDAYVGNTLKRLDSDGRVHPKINSLAARTARMSVNNPPLHQIPSGLADVRHMYLAEPGCYMASIDFSSVELKVLGALSKDPTMIHAFKNNLDLHTITADSADVPRKVGKMTNFAKVYGGGAKTIARQAGVPIDVAQRVVRSFDTTYPGVASFSKRLSTPIEAGQRNFVKTYSGRRLPVDSDRAYSALNYYIQSTARDVLGKAMINVWNAGLWDNIVLPIHDELLCSLPADDAEELCREIGFLMECDLEGVYLDTEPDLGLEAWGSLYENGDDEAGVEAQHSVVSFTDADREVYRKKYA